LTITSSAKCIISHSAQPHGRGRAGDEDIRVYTYIIILGEAEELSDLGSTLGAETLGVHDVGQAGDIVVALLDDAESEHGQIHGDDAATDGFTLALTSTAGAVAGVALREQETDTGWVHDSLLHWETLLVVAAGDSEDVALEFISNTVTWDLCAHSVGIISISSDVSCRCRAYLLSMKTRSFFSSSISISFCEPLLGKEMFYCAYVSKCSIVICEYWESLRYIPASS